MAHPLDKFGTYVELIVKDKAKTVIFNSVSKPKTDADKGSPYLDKLRVDFDMRLVPRHGRLKVEVYNLSNETITSLVEGEDLTMEIWVGLHGKLPVILGHSMYVSNVLSAIKVPNTVTSLFGFTELKKTLLEVQMSDAGAIKKGATFEQAVTNMVKLAVQKGEVKSANVRFSLVPPTMLSRKLAKKRTLTGSLEDMLDAITKEHGCSYYTDETGVVIVYIANTPYSEESAPLENSVGQIVIDPSNLRSNPKVSLGSMTLDINLEPSI